MKKHLLGTLFLFLLFVSCSKEETESKIEIKEPETEEPGDDVPVILADNTIQLTQEMISQVSEVVKGRDFILNSSVEESKVPKVGQVLLVSEASEKFPYGFLGKVTQINKEAGGYKISTESVPLDVAFEKLSINQTIDLVPENETSTRSLLPDEDGFFWIEKDCEKGDEDNKVEGGLSVGCKLQCVIDINNKAHKPMASFVLISRLKANLSLDLKCEGEKEVLKIPFGHFPLKIATISPVGAAVTIVMQPSIDLDFIVSTKGEMTLNAKGEFFKEVISGMVYKDGNWKGGSHEQKSEGINGFKITESEFKMDGSLFEGVRMGVNIVLFTAELANASFNVRAGLGQKAHLEVDMMGQNFYDQFKDSYLQTYLEIGVQGEAAIPILGDEKSWGPKDLIEPIQLMKKDYYLFPSFNDMEVTTDEKKMTAVVSASVKRDLLFKSTQMNMGLYDKNEKLVQSSDLTAYSKEDEFPNPWQVPFTSLKANTKYNVRPIIKFPVFNATFKASPIKDFIIEKNEITTLDAVNIKTGEATCKGNYQLPPDELPLSYGICYSFSNQVPTVSDSKVLANNVDMDGNFSVRLTGLKDDEIYNYRAFVVLEDRTVYGETKILSSNFPIGIWRNTYVEWRERLLSDPELTSRKEEVNKIIVFLANGRLGTLDNLGNVIESSTDTYQYDKSVKKMTITVYDAEDKKMVTDTMDVEITSDGFTLTNHWIDEDMESYTINTFVKVE